MLAPLASDQSSSIMLLVKGTPADALLACARRALPARVAGITRYGETIMRLDSAAPCLHRQVQAWFTEPHIIRQSAPYPVGTLLYYRIPQGAER